MKELREKRLSGREKSLELSEESLRKISITRKKEQNMGAACRDLRGWIRRASFGQIQWIT